MEIIPHASQMCSALLPVLTAGAQALAVGGGFCKERPRLSVPFQAQPSPGDLLQGTAEPINNTAGSSSDIFLMVKNAAQHL